MLRYILLFLELLFRQGLGYAGWHASKRLGFSAVSVFTN